MDTKDTCFCEESFNDGSILVLEILREGAPWLHKPMVNRINSFFLTANAFKIKVFAFLYTISEVIYLEKNFYDGSPKSRGIIILTNQLSLIELFLKV